MFRDKIVTLDNKSEYFIINEAVYNNRFFVLGAKVDTKNDFIDIDNLLVKEVIVVDGSAKYVKITDNELLNKVSAELILKAHNEAV